MVSGFDRYFQIAPCFRDEDARADRSPGEFYQLDLEMSFATQDDVFSTVEGVLGGLFTEFGRRGPVATPFPRISFADALLRFGTDKPDLRIPLEIRDLSATFAASAFRAFAGRTVRALRVPGGAALARSWFDRVAEHAVGLGAQGLAWVLVGEGLDLTGPIVKFLAAEERRALAVVAEGPGDAVLVLADNDERLVTSILGDVRLRIGNDLSLVDDTKFNFCWVTDFPMYERNPDTGQIEFSHNPFSMPQGGMQSLLEKDPLHIKAFQYDIVCNGIELSSGAVRNHDPQTMYKAFEIAGYDRAVVDQRFPALQQAFQYGAPPHAGIAPGLDRIVMLIAEEPNIREVIAFPMNQRAQDLLMNAPSDVTQAQLRELHLQVLP
jgi:aspartyl-tRNA synthetase